MSSVDSAQARAQNNAEKHAATRNWLESQPLHCQENASSEDDGELESLADSSVIESSDACDDSDTDGESKIISTAALGTQTVSNDVMHQLQELFNSINSVQTVGNVTIENSTGVHIGNVTNINGNIQIIQRVKRAHGDRRHKPQQLKTTPSSRRSSSSLSNTRTTAPHIITEEPEERMSRDAFLDRIKFKIPKHACHIVPRSTWVAQMPMEDYDYLQEPAEYVIISHTATESSEKQGINIRIIRDVQCFHIESREWNDIAYNFLVGCDGNVYEGRGWGVIGAHTRYYNRRSIGISFIGCFMRVLPHVAALNACKNLLKRGVAEGYLASNYKLICHCQCTSTESPGRKLFEEIQKWEHFYDIGEENEDNGEAKNDDKA